MSEHSYGNFNATESAIYQAVLEGGKLTLSSVAKRTGHNRTTLYPYVDTLLQQDYLLKTISGKRTYYTAASPEKLFKRLQANVAGFEAQLPFLLEIYKRAKKQPVIEFYEGKKAIFKAFKQAYQEAFYIKTFFEFGNFAQVFSMQKEGNELLKLLSEREIEYQGLASNTSTSTEFVKKYIEDGVNARLMPAGITFPAEFFIYNQKVLIVSYERKFAVVIESEDITSFLVTIFNHFWKTATPIK